MDGCFGRSFRRSQRSSLRDTCRRGRCSGALLVNFDRIDLPVSLRVSGGIQGDVANTAFKSTCRVAHDAFRAVEYVSRPITAESCIKDKSLSQEFLCHVTGALEVSHWGSKSRCIRLAILYALRDGIARKEPNFNVLVGPFHRVSGTSESITYGPERKQHWNSHSALDIVEAGAEAVLGAFNSTSRGSFCQRALVCCQCTRHTGIDDLAISLGVQDHFILGRHIDALDDVYISH